MEAIHLPQRLLRPQATTVATATPPTPHGDDSEPMWTTPSKDTEDKRFAFYHHFGRT